jgi:hypothetical protein
MWTVDPPDLREFGKSKLRDIDVCALNSLKVERSSRT